MDKNIVLMRQLIVGFQFTQAIYVVSKFNIADELKENSQTIDVLAEKLKLNPERLYRLMRALASKKIFEEKELRTFFLTPLAELLTKEHPNSLKYHAIMYGEETYRTWAELDSILKNDEVAFETLYEEPFFDYLTTHPKQAKVFNQAMKNSTSSHFGNVVKNYDFSRFHHIVDVGGGYGQLLEEILPEHHNLKATVFDLEEAIQNPEEHVTNKSILSRITFEAGDFFESITPGGDLYILRHIIHDWPDEKAEIILKHCREAIDDRGKLLLIEGVILPGNKETMLKWIDLNMMLMLNSKERTEEEFRSLLEKAGFRLTRIIETNSWMNLLEAEPVL